MLIVKYQQQQMRYKGVLIDEISLFGTPKLYFELVLMLLKDQLKHIEHLLLNRSIPICVGMLTWIVVANVSWFETLYDFVRFSVYWLLLGVASSIGLGTGLHTFILYLGPHIAKVALTSTMCGLVPEMLPSRWKFQHFGECSNPTHQEIGILGIMFAVQLQSFLWGFGTALGQLPPYFVAKKAAQTRVELKKMTREVQTHPGEGDLLREDEVLDEEPRIFQQNQIQSDFSEEITEMMELRQKTDLNLIEKAKLFIYNNMEKYGFWAILVCASIPNPLFDLAGITSGHFRIPFRTFFSATVIGKAIIKVHLQMFFIIAIFRKQTLDMLVSVIQWVSVRWADNFHRNLQLKKKQLNQPYSIRESSSFLSVLWDLFITGMVLYFLKSIMDAYVKEKAIMHRDN